VPLYEDMLEDVVSIDVKYRNRVHRIGYRPDRYTDAMHLKLRDLRAAPDFSPLDAMIVELVGEWDIDRIKRDAAGQPIDVNGDILTDRSRQTPATEMMPITLQVVANLPCFMKMAFIDAICDDVMASAGNAKGTSGTTPAAESSAPGVPASSTPAQSAGQPSPLPSVRPALVTVPPLG
jgi:hypothetical protein